MLHHQVMITCCKDRSDQDHGKGCPTPFCNEHPLGCSLTCHHRDGLPYTSLGTSERYLFKWQSLFASSRTLPDSPVRPLPSVDNHSTAAARASRPEVPRSSHLDRPPHCCDRGERRWLTSWRSRPSISPQRCYARLRVRAHLIIYEAAFASLTRAISLCLRCGRHVDE